ncbi:MAG: hypothetical protein KDE45_12605, partial [Caldilineaceae bacterium]|nr:hypothetical protein [Caldilineaceae bacterium]
GGGSFYGDAFVVRLNAAGNALDYATFLGGSSNDSGDGLALDATGRAIVTGFTGSSDFPITPSAFDPSYSGGYADAFVVRLNAAGSDLDFATFLGGSDSDSGRDLALDTAGRATVMGYTLSSDFPTTPGAFDTSHNGGADVFVVRLNSAGSALDYATFLGGGRTDSGADLALDAAGRATIMGSTQSSDFPITFGAFDTSPNGILVAFLARLSVAGNSLEYATFFGGSAWNEGLGMALDADGRAVLTGVTEASDFPITPGAFDTTYNGEGDAFVAKLSLIGYTPNVVAPIEQPTAGAFVSSAATLRGFAIDLASSSGTGIDMVHIYLDGPYGTGAIIGAATYGLDRPDIAAQYGSRFGPSGWELLWNTAGLSLGPHQLYVYAHRTTDNAWSVMELHLVLVAGGRLIWLPTILRQR